MKKGWRNDIAYVERRERKQRERDERAMMRIKAEMSRAFDEARRQAEVHERTRRRLMGLCPDHEPLPYGQVYS